MTPQEEARIRADLLLAFADGKLQKYSRNFVGEWGDWGYEYPEIKPPLSLWRRKPEQKRRPWKWNEVPVGGVIRRPGDDGGGTHLITGVLTSGRMSLNGDFALICVDKVSSDCEWKWPHEPDTAWRKCGVYE